jgi:ABC-type Fe3+-hydroxamate transport system substrate-binding protein
MMKKLLKFEGGTLSGSATLGTSYLIEKNPQYIFFSGHLANGTVFLNKD